VGGSAKSRVRHENNQQRKSDRRLTDRSDFAPASESLVFSLERPLNRRAIGRLFHQGFRVPLIPGRIKKIATVNVNAAAFT